MGAKTLFLIKYPFKIERVTPSIILNCLCSLLCVLVTLFMCRYLLKAEATLDNEILHVDSKSTTLGPQLIFISKKPPFEPRPVSVFKAGENACKDCF